MITSNDSPRGGLYALKLLAADPAHPERIAGRLEHVLSGRRYDFADGSALLNCLLTDAASHAEPAAVHHSA